MSFRGKIPSIQNSYLETNVFSTFFKLHQKYADSLNIHSFPNNYEFKLYWRNSGVL